MSDLDPSSESPNLEALQSELESMRAETEALGEANRRLGRRLADLEGVHADTHSVAADPSRGAPGLAAAETEGPGSSTPFSRRGALLALGGAAAGGVGLALGSSLPAAVPAGATTGAMMYGETNNAGTAITALESSTPVNDVAFIVTNPTTGGYPIYGVAVGESGLQGPVGSAVVGDTNNPAAAGVAGLNSDGYGVYGQVGSGIAVYGQNGSPSNLLPVTGSAIVGVTSNGGAGVEGMSTAGPGLYGISTTGNGISGVANAVSGLETLAGGGGVVGDTNNPDGAGVQGMANQGVGVYGQSVSSVGVLGTSATYYAVQGETTGESPAAVYGVNLTSALATSAAVFGVGSAAMGVSGTSFSGAGVSGASTQGIGVSATGGLAPLLLTPGSTAGAPTTSGHSMGELYVDSEGTLFQCVASGSPGTWVPVVSGGDVVLGQANTAEATTTVSTAVGDGVQGATTANGSAGLSGQDTSTGGGSGVTGSSTAGIGVVAAGGLAPLKLSPATSTGAPSTGAHTVGEVFVDKTGTVFICTGAGSPGTWAQSAVAGPSAFSQGALCLLPNPIRLADTRVGATAPLRPGRPVTGGTKLVVPVTGQAVGSVSIPSGAVAVVGNLTAVNAAARGYLTAWPDGATQPGVSSLNFPPTTAIANGVTVAMSPAGKMDVFASQTTDVIFDATGFVA